MALNPVSGHSIKDLKGEIVGAPDLQVLRIVATVDAMSTRGLADALIAPLRQRLSVLRPRRPLRFARLLFHPLDSLIVPAPRWRPGEDSIPRTALAAMAEHVRQAMDHEAEAIDRHTAGHTDAETDLVTRLGRMLWPMAAKVFRAATVPATWESTGLGSAAYRPIGDCVAALLDEAAALEAICTETANGMLPIRPEAIAVMLDHISAANPAALPMLIALLLIRLPESPASILALAVGPRAVAVNAAMDKAIDRVLRQLNVAGGTEELIAAGTLSDAGSAASHIKTLLTQLDSVSSKPQRREQLRTIRQRLDASCKARFTMGLEEDLLAPLQRLGASPDQAAVQSLEIAARGLRVLEIEARAVGSGAAYDLLLRRTVEAIKDTTAGNHLAKVDQIRLVELLSGPEAALAMLEQPQ